MSSRSGDRRTTIVLSAEQMRRLYAICRRYNASINDMLAVARLAAAEESERRASAGGSR